VIGPGELAHALRQAAPFVLLRRQVPLVLGLVITDRCNLACRHCRVANVARRDMPFALVEQKLDAFHARGVRELAIEGGEPFLWRNGERRLEDVVTLARRIGYRHVHVYTNGMFPIVSSADTVWVSVDGLRESFARIRGDHFERVIAHIRAARARKLAIVFVVNTVNRQDVRPFLRFARDLPVMGVIFYLHTPYYGRDELFLDAPARAAVIDELLACRRDGLPVLNSASGLELLRSGGWPKPNRTWWIADEGGDYPCCRAANPEVCADCGYAACTELIAAQRLRPDAIRTLLRLA